MGQIYAPNLDHNFTQFRDLAGLDGASPNIFF